MSKINKEVRQGCFLGITIASTAIGIAKMITDWRRKNKIADAKNEKELKQIKTTPKK